MSSSREGVLLRAGSPALAAWREQVPTQQQYEPSAVERRSSIRRAEDQPVNGGGPSFRLGDVYADELARLREQAHAEGFAAGHADGLRGRGLRGRRGRARRHRADRRGPGALGAPAGVGDRRDDHRGAAPRRVRRAGRRRDPRDHRRDGAHPARGPPRPRARPGRLPRPRRRAPGAHPLPGRRAGHRPRCTPTTSARSPRTPWPTCRTASASSPTRRSSAPAPWPRPDPGASTPSSMAALERVQEVPRRSMTAGRPAPRHLAPPAPGRAARPEVTGSVTGAMGLTLSRRRHLGRRRRPRGGQPR